MNKLDYDTRDLGLSSEAIIKADKDISTIGTLNKITQKMGAILVLSGGYATEALCGGKITRAHGDIDVHVILPNGLKSIEIVLSEIKDTLSCEETKWIARERNPKRVDFVEDKETNDYFEKRKVEIHLHQSSESNIQYVKSKLVDSRGNEVGVFVVGLLQTVAGKIHKFFELKDGVDATKDRHSSESDYGDLKRLLSLWELDKKQIIALLSEKSGDKANAEFDYVESLVNKHFT